MDDGEWKEACVWGPSVPNFQARRGDAGEMAMLRTTGSWNHTLGPPTTLVAAREVATNYTLEGTLRTEYGAKAPDPGTATNSSSVEAIVVQRHHPNDLLLAVGLLAIPVLIVCIVHSLLACRKIKNAKGQQGTPKSPPGHLSPVSPAESVCVASPPQQMRRTKSKSVTWQSPFETKARTSHRISTQRATPSGELHFVMVSTPEKTHTPVQQFIQNQRVRNSRVLPPLQLMFTDDDEEATPPHPLIRLDSSPPLSDVSRTPSSLSLSPWPSSPPPLLEDNGEYDSDSPRVSMSSAISDDHEAAERTIEVITVCDHETRLSETPVEGTAAKPLTSCLARCSSSLDDFRHDLHHEQTDEEDPDTITRSSEYSF